ncbi:MULTISPECIES: VOC family protein [Frankia]|uniref:VOC family protein n=1 Tax=Frankia TaxID=1854 RepID=UPI0012FFB86D
MDFHPGRRFCDSRAAPRFYAPCWSSDPYDARTQVLVRAAGRAAAAAEALGATHLGDVVEDDTSGVLVLADPESNEFCFVTG